LLFQVDQFISCYCYCYFFPFSSSLSSLLPLLNRDEGEVEDETNNHHSSSLCLCFCYPKDRIIHSICCDFGMLRQLSSYNFSLSILSSLNKYLINTFDYILYRNPCNKNCKYSSNYHGTASPKYSINGIYQS
jgi:hypothetical protein